MTMIYNIFITMLRSIYSMRNSCRILLLCIHI